MSDSIDPPAAVVDPRGTIFMSYRQPTRPIALARTEYMPAELRELSPLHNRPGVNMFFTATFGAVHGWVNVRELGYTYR